MKIKCQNKKCSFIINIPLDKLPQQPVKIACPKCKGPNIIKPPSASRPDTGLYERIMGEVDKKLSGIRNELAAQSMVTRASSSGPYETYQPDVRSKKALICDDDRLISEMIKDIVVNLGFTTNLASTVDQAMSILDKPDMDYGLILIDKVFPEDTEGGYKIISQIAAMPLDTRRKMFVIFISGDIKSMDTSSAFLTGANTVVNKKDINKLKDIITRELSDYERLYSVFNQCLHMSKTYSH